MALQKQAMEIAFAAGLAERVRPEVLDPRAAFLTLSNVRQDKRGAFTKRRGTTALSTGVMKTIAASGTIVTPPAIAAGFRSGARQGDTPWAIDGHYLYERSEEDASWARVGRVPECVERRGPGPQPIGVLGVGREVAFCNGYLVVTTVATDLSGTAIWLHVLDEASGAKVYGPVQVATKVNPNALGTTQDLWTGQTWFHKIVVAGTTAWVIYALQDLIVGKQIRGTKLDLSSVANLFAHRTDIALVPAADLPIAKEGATGAGWGATGGAAGFAIAYLDTTGHLNAVRFDANAFVQALSGGYGTSNVNTRAIDLDGLDGDTLWLAWDRPISGTSAEVRVLGLDPVGLGVISSEAVALSLTSAVSVAAIWATIGVMAVDVGRGLVVSSHESSPGGSNFNTGRAFASLLQWRDFTTAAGATVPNAAGTRQAPNIELYARPCLVDGKAYAITHSGWSNDTGANNSVWCVDLDMSDFATPGGPVRPIANVAPFLCGATAVSARGFQRSYSAHDVAHVSATKKKFVIPIARNASDPQGVEIVEIDFDDANLWQPAPDAQQVAFSGGVACIDDGVNMQESSFLRPPTLFAVAVPGGTQSTLGANASYQYAAIYEYIDSQGNVHWSEPAVVTVATLNNPQNLQIFVGTLGVSVRESKIVSGHAPWSAYSVVLYRTAAGGSTFYRLPTITNVDFGSNASPTRANGAALYVSFVDSNADAAIVTQPQLYTQPGQLGTPLPRRAPPSLTCLIQHSDNLVGVDETGRKLWFSSERVDGEGFWWNDLTTIAIDDDSRIIALASFDGRIWALTDTSIWYLDGQGFTDNGGGGYSPPVKLPVDDGCIDPRSVVVTPMGAFFQSALGIMLLSRSAEVQYIGEPVAKTLAAFPVITSAVLNPAEHVVVFTCASGETGAGATAPGVLIVFDYVGQLWFTWTLNSGTPAIQSVSMQLVDGAHTMAFLDTSGVMYLESGDFLDDGAWVAMQMETGWIKTGGLQGFQRVWRMFLLFARSTAHDLTIEFAFDYVDSYTETRAYTSTQIAAMNPQELEHHLKQQKCRAVKMRFTDAAPSGGEPVGSGEGSALLGLRAVFGVKQKTPFAAGAR